MDDAQPAISTQWPRRWSRNAFPPKETAVTVVAAIAIGAALLFAGAGIVGSRFVGASEKIVAIVIVQLLVELAMVACLIGNLPRLTRFSFGELGFRRPTYSAIVTALGCGIAMVVVVDGGASLIESLLHAKHEQQTIAMFEGIHDPAIVAFFATFAIVFAPIMEELIFRVFVFNVGLRYGGFWLGASVSALLFASAHTDLYAFLPLFLGGLVLSFAYYRTNNAFASMIAHGLFNSFTVVGLLAVPSLAK